METDYETYVAAVICNEANGTVFPVILSTNRTLDNPQLIDRLEGQFRVLDLEAVNFKDVYQGESCFYHSERMVEVAQLLSRP